MLRVMIVDDSRSSLLRPTRMMSADADPSSQCFGQGEQALEAAADELFGLIIVDHVTPKTDGVALVRPLCALPTSAQVPTVMLTGTSSRAVRLEAVEAGATAFSSGRTARTNSPSSAAGTSPSAAPTPSWRPAHGVTPVRAQRRRQRWTRARETAP